MPVTRSSPADLLGARSAAEVRERFLRDVLTRVPADRVREAYLFAPIRQGPIESGVAVLAVSPEGPPDPPPGADADVLAVEPLDVERRTVYVARYRLTRKGPERGRWDVAVREEADAPLPAVDAAVRGVGRRANDAGEAERLDAEALQAFAPAPAAAPALL